MAHHLRPHGGDRGDGGTDRRADQAGRGLRPGRGRRRRRGRGRGRGRGPRSPGAVSGSAAAPTMGACPSSSSQVSR
ncbi:hypothetical protein F3K20_39440 [Streptomyces scabiei]|nr:hypothetical protein [Streptomyces sp. LBUM 1484]MBP5880189.1 hypothetical protein [Streptomyces sp. LBUM 1477]MBP5888026.1 hypothetical protein [Streptomyces sp. LBUM 1487]MBP5904039.1 hypothetical protein [Streptomyces sp. LBUM 1488]QTU50082.1 hypothetical protein F3K20_39440 [Streptomyces sp. LBUM 1482]QTU66302.1 hypothetical protein F3K22_39545 [Streptomyces sp. LBUM 1475]